ncbi:MAG TPA: UvrB/UvrC motif-containing protein [Spirochaetota bacterium]|nr:UvrB/UvrC motif-containing protein [Spirochaetota bacterium]
MKNVKSEIHLCEKCAKEFGLNTKFSKFSLTVPDMLSFLDVHEVNPSDRTAVCMSCGSSYIDIRKRGRLGCPDCYRYLGAELESIILNVHGRNRHVGKIPAYYVEMKSFSKPLIDSDLPPAGEMSDLDELRRQLDDAVMNERYEEAALLRDRIRGLQAKAHGA